MDAGLLVGRDFAVSGSFVASPGETESIVGNPVIALHFSPDVAEIDMSYWLAVGLPIAPTLADGFEAVSRARTVAQLLGYPERAEFSLDEERIARLERRVVLDGGLEFGERGVAVGQPCSFQRATEPTVKPEPLIVTTAVDEPMTVEIGSSCVMAGVPPPPPLVEIVNVSAPEVPPPGVGEKTVTDAEPALWTSAAVMAAVSEDEDTNVVVRLLPFQRTTEPATKFEPFTVRVNAPDPATRADGLRVVSTGTGFCAAPMLNDAFRSSTITAVL